MNIADSSLRTQHGSSFGSLLTFLTVMLWQPLVVGGYLCLPRALIVWRVPSSELQLSYGFFDQTLAYVGVLLAFYHVARWIPSDSSRRFAGARSLSGCTSNSCCAAAKRS